MNKIPIENKAHNLFNSFLAIVALFMVFLITQFIKNYYFIVHSEKSNMLTSISFWIIVIGGFIFSAGLVLFRRWIYIKRKKLPLFFSVFFLGIIFIELFLQITHKHSMRFSPHQYLNYIGTPNYRSADGLNIHNSLGMRGPEIIIPKPAGRIRIAILGGSTAYEEFVKDWKKDFARQLELKLKQLYSNKDVEVVNAGLPGWDSWEDLINLEFRLIDLNLDAIIVYEGVNDVHARFVRPDSYKSDNSGNKSQWIRKPCLVLLCLKTVQLITGFDPYNFDFGTPTYTHPTTNDYNAILGMTPMEALGENPPIYFERNLRNITAIAHENNIAVLLSTWAWSDQLGDYAATPHYQRGFRELNRVIKKVGTSKQILIYDFASEMPKDKKYWADGPHNNLTGVTLKAKLFANYIVKTNFLDNIKISKKEKLL